MTLAVGCGKPEKAVVTPPAEKPPVTAAAESNAVEVTVAAIKAKPITEVVEIPPLSEELQTMILSNRLASVDEQLAAIAKAALNDTQKAQACLLLLPLMNRDGQRPLAHAAVGYLSDKTRALIEEPLHQGKLDPQILSIFLTDTLKQPNRVKLPVLLGLVLSPGHPMQAEAQELLANFLGKDHGTNWAAWEQAVRAYVAKYPVGQ